MKKILAAVLMTQILCGGSLAASANMAASRNETLIAQCSVPDGYRLFPVEEAARGADGGPSGEPGFSGTVSVTRDPSGKYDMRYIDRMREIASLVGGAGVITPGKATANELVIFANYRGETEVFTFSKKTPEELQFTLISSSPGHERIEKKANVVGSCSYLNFEHG